ncbi:cation diffusion facilitator family transporter [Asanoa hainanensis]|uniref:Cation diffusion facilitator family transporter n=1 Tax=Asanoa hainanensis TaxID=560556 RepID=A0A239P9N3_9ACTN|nr:cation diffusion facilitator family transporter [Asanoa hainanensis]
MELEGEPEVRHAAIPDQDEAPSESVLTVIIAGLANLAIAVAKFVAGLLTGSAALLSEAAHSVADTTTEALLYTALRRGAKDPDDRHPFGYGKESYVWAFLAALFTFVAGAGFSIYRGIETILHGEDISDFAVGYIVLAVSAVLEGISFLRALRQVRGEATRWRTSPFRFLRLTPDTTVKAVFLEDSAALIGLALAAAGLGLTEATGDPIWDGIASIGIGMLLLVVAFVLSLANISLLVGQSVPRRLHQRLREELAAVPTVDRVDQLLTMQLGPDDVLVAAKVDFDDTATGAEIEAAADAAERRLISVYPSVRYVFLDPTRGRAGRDRPDR